MSVLVALLISLVFFVGTKCDIKEQIKADFFTIYKRVAIETKEIQHVEVTPDKVTYFLYTKNNPDEYIQLNDNNLNLLENKKIVFFVHGWTNSRKIGWYEDLKNAFLTNYKDYHIIEVDWEDPAAQLYYVASINTHDVAKFIANFIVNLNKNFRVRLDDVLLIGHSLGGQVIGFVGKEVFKLTGQKLPRIIALDPAGPIFSQSPEDKRLNKDDADIVQVIHTDGGTFGYKNAIGTIDFFPNGGSSQPGCVKVDLLRILNVVDPLFCDHRRAYEYFVEAILHPKEFVAKECKDWDSYKENKCNNATEVAMGDLTTKATGFFYLETNKDKPYRKINNEEGGLKNKLLKLVG